MAQRAPGMIFLTPGHKVIEDVVSKCILTSERRQPCDVTLPDFDEILYHLFTNDDVTELTLSFSSRITDDLRNFGGDKMLENVYGSMVVDPEPGFELSLTVNLDDLPDAPEVIVKKFSELKRHLYGAPFTTCFEALLEGTTSDLPPIRIAFREKETIYIVPGKSNVAIIFSFDFSDPADVEIGRLFLKEFSEVRRVNGAPPCAFGRDPPGEIKDMELREDLSSCIGYITFSILPSHVKGTKLDNCVTLMQGFREYVLYHIKASKTYLHTRMRKQAHSLQQVLNRAKPNVDKKKKLMSGRTFNRK